MCFFYQIHFFTETAKDNNFDGQCDWMSKSSQDVRSLGFSWKNTGRFSEKNYLFKKRWN